MFTTAAFCSCQRAVAVSFRSQQRGAQHLPRASADQGASSSGGSGSSGSGGSELPPELQGLCISDDGQNLIDSTTGKVVNEFGATRFDVAVRAMRGEFDPPTYLENTERSSSLLLDSLTQFPAVYDFQLVVRPPQQAQQAQQQDGSSAAGAVLERYRQLIADTTAADIPPEACTVKERLGGKYISLTIPARVQAAHVVDLVWAALADDPAVLMKY